MMRRSAWSRQAGAGGDARHYSPGLFRTIQAGPDPKAGPPLLRLSAYLLTCNLKGLHWRLRGAAPARSTYPNLIKQKDAAMNINLTLAPLISLVAGILILIVPRALNYIVAIYLIIVGLIGLFGADIRLR
jgi:hypothetical protein